MKKKRVILDVGYLIVGMGAYSCVGPEWEPLTHHPPWTKETYPKGRLIFEYKERNR